MFYSLQRYSFTKYTPSTSHGVGHVATDSGH